MANINVDIESSDSGDFLAEFFSRYFVNNVLTEYLDEECDYSVEAGYIRRLKKEFGHLSFYDQVVFLCILSSSRFLMRHHKNILFRYENVASSP